LFIIKKFVGIENNKKAIKEFMKLAANEHQAYLFKYFFPKQQKAFSVLHNL